MFDGSICAELVVTPSNPTWNNVIPYQSPRSSVSIDVSVSEDIEYGRLQTEKLGASPKPRRPGLVPSIVKWIAGSGLSQILNNTLICFGWHWPECY